MMELLNNFIAAINMEAMAGALTLMWQGMLGIFVVMLIITIILYIAAKITK